MHTQRAAILHSLSASFMNHLLHSCRETDYENLFTDLEKFPDVMAEREVSRVQCTGVDIRATILNTFLPECFSDSICRVYISPLVLCVGYIKCEAETLGPKKTISYHTLRSLRRLH